VYIVNFESSFIFNIHAHSRGILECWNFGKAIAFLIPFFHHSNIPKSFILLETNHFTLVGLRRSFASNWALISRKLQSLTVFNRSLANLCILFHRRVFTERDQRYAEYMPSHIKKQSLSG